MRIQCTCGAKFSFEVTPEMKDRPARFVCPACGLDSSETVNALVQQELAGRPAGAGLIPTDIPRPTATVPRAVPRAPAQPAPGLCSKHGEPTAAKCCVCGKPICPRCMEVFGYLCSPLCKARAQSHGISVPVCENQRTVVEDRFWRKTARAGWVVAGVLILLLGFWIWYAWFGSQPSQSFSVRFEQPAYSGQIASLGKDSLVVLHGGTLARYNLNSRKPAWSRYLVDRKAIEADAARQVNDAKAIAAKAQAEGWEEIPGIPQIDELIPRLERRAAANLELRLHGENIWVSQLGKLVLHDTRTGVPKKEIPTAGGFSDMISRGDEVWFVEKFGTAAPTLTKVNLKTAVARTQEVGAPPGAVLADGSDPEANTATAGLPSGTPGKDLGKPMDPGKVAAQVQQLSTPARVALPAMLANTLNQERMLEELKSEDPGRKFVAKPGETIQLVPAPEGFLQFSVKMIEARFEERDAMGPDDTSALNGPISMASSAQMANTMLNQIQRARGGGIIREDRSLYLVTLRDPGASEANAWKAEVTGYPKVYPLETVTVLAAGKAIRVLDKQHRKLWEGQLKYPVYGGLNFLDAETAPIGRGPCVEHNKTLFIYDAGELTAFDLFTGRVRWTISQAGVAGLFFDDKGLLYVNVTSEGLRHLQYSRDMSLWQKVSPMVMKIDPVSGNTFWAVEPGGMLQYVSGKYLYTISIHDPDMEDEDYSYRRETGYERAPFVRIKRLDPANGRKLWEHFQPRAPLDFRFDEHRIELLFKKEVQVLDYFSL